jgi:2-amino-4-hydroxy-6-hydroxymethyldihydropteridine diphosphokinase
MHITYLGIGTNHGDRRKNLAKAMALIEGKAGRIIKSSSVYETEPWGFESPHFFLNTVIKVETELSPLKLLEMVHIIEAELGRKRSRTRYVSRVMDIDILFYDDEVISTKELVIPHPLIAERKFVLVPLTEVEPELVHPVSRKTIAELLSRCNDKSYVSMVE